MSVFKLLIFLVLIHSHTLQESPEYEMTMIMVVMMVQMVEMHL